MMTNFIIKHKKNSKAHGVFNSLSKKITLKKGSVLIIDLNNIPTPNIAQNYKSVCQHVSAGDIKRLRNGSLKVVKDITGLSPSAAGVFADGKAGSGWRAWELCNGKLLDSLRAGAGQSTQQIFTVTEEQVNARMLFKKWVVSQKLQNSDTMIAMIATQRDEITARLKRTITKPLRVVSSSALKAKTRIIKEIIIDSIQDDAKKCQGVIYLVFRKTEKGEIDPLYVGITEAYGNDGASLNSVVKNGSMRFADYYGSGGHIGNINDALFGKESSESHWVGALFSTQSTLSGETPKAVLKQPVFVHFDIWDINGKSMEPSHTLPSLRKEETTRIRILRAAGYRKQLLNRT